MLSDEVLIGWLRDAAPGCQWTASVCTGDELYAAAGLLEGTKTTTHWGLRDKPAGRWVSRWSRTASCGRFAESLQLLIEYDPQPPFDSGSPDKAAAGTLRLALRMLLGDRPFQMAARVSTQAATARFRRALAERRQ